MAKKLNIKTFFLLITIIFSLVSTSISAQEVMDDLTRAKLIEEDNEVSSFPTEVILKIAVSKKIMLLSNTNNSYQEGDYLSLILNKRLMVRVLCAKIDGQNCGIKLIRIYEDPLWIKAYEGMEVQVLRGDDAQFKIDQDKPEVAEEPIDVLKDLYEDDELIDSDSVEITDNKARLLKNDNIIGLSYGLLLGVDNENEPHNYGHWHFQWAYQMADNFWAEVLVGQAIIGQFPNDTLDTQITSMTIRFKYTIKAPFYSFVLPYVGYQSVVPNSPDVGVPYLGSTIEDLNKELDTFDNMKRNHMIFGVTILKRIVPGWFLRVDLGNDFISSGLSLEF